MMQEWLLEKSECLAKLFEQAVARNQGHGRYQLAEEEEGDLKLDNPVVV